METGKGDDATEAGVTGPAFHPVKLTVHNTQIVQEVAQKAGVPKKAVQRVIDALAALAQQEPTTSADIPEAGPEARPAGTLHILSDPHTQASIRSMWEPQEWAQPADGYPYYQDRETSVQVYLVPLGTQGEPTPETIAVASRELLGLDDNKVSAFIICMGKWLAETKSDSSHILPTRVHVDDVLAFRGVQKHHKGGYRREQKEETRADLLALRHIWVRSEEEVWETNRRGRRRKVQVNVNSPLLEISYEAVSEDGGGDLPYAFRIRPGDWAKSYLGPGTRWTALMLQTITRYDPRQGVGRLAMRLGIYLTMQWRIRARTQNFDQPWQMSTLLEGARITLPDRNKDRFRKEVERALVKLHQDGILGRCECLDPLTGDEAPKEWWSQWLRTRWVVQPVPDVQERYAAIGLPVEAPPPPGRQRKEQ